MCVVDATYQARQDPDPFPETLVEVDGSAGTLRLRQGYALTVTGREGTVAPRGRACAAALGEPALARHPGERARHPAPLGRLPAARPRARDLGRRQPQDLRACEAAYASAATGDTVTPSV